MSTDPANKPARRADDDVPGRLAAIDQRLHQVSSQLATIGTLFSQLDEIHANLETLIGSHASAGPIVMGAACGLPGCGMRADQAGSDG